MVILTGYRESRSRSSYRLVMKKEIEFGSVILFLYIRVATPPVLHQRLTTVAPPRRGETSNIAVCSDAAPAFAPDANASSRYSRICMSCGILHVVVRKRWNIRVHVSLYTTLVVYNTSMPLSVAINIVSQM